MTGTFVEAWLDGFDRHRFYTRTYTAEPSKAVVVFVPGFTDHIGRYEDILPRFAQRGFTVFAYDMRGFGRTALDVEHRSPDEYYGKTNRLLEIADLEWWIAHVAREYPGAPIFLFSFSSGAALASAFVTRTRPPPAGETVSKLSGIIAQSPLYRLHRQPSVIVRSVVRGISRIAPAFPLPAPVLYEGVSHDPAVAKAMKNDRLRMSRGTARGLDDMISQGNELVREDYKHWPKDLPLLMTWGKADKINCYKSGIQFFNKLEIEDKKLLEYEDALHDLLREAGEIPDKVIHEYLVWLESHAKGHRVPHGS
ncbi:hypothetical protein BN946_scf184722.g3 [Trametes cinnabarina]|uniref:Serine aminopeptidase S33 domain-containing protein n=1 Tax=Pycnoporus cinnabarinus TaxID=5643 RepID=A0A060SUN0_PYCCI|nr:hypothetical protein BN946_scf184722.g3 [Trametes cinnabarina]